MLNKDIFISLPELETLIQGLEEKYGISTAEFLASRDEFCQQIEEDDVFKWEAYMAHRHELRRSNEAVRHVYLSQLTLQEDNLKAPAPEDQFDLAA